MQDLSLKSNIQNSIKTWIDSRNISIHSFASAVDVSYTSAYRWYSGICIPDVDLFPKLCEFMGISITEFLGLDKSSDKQHDILYLYASDENFRNLVDKYMSNPEFKQSIDSLVKLTK